uniref:Uncharacterized protein n=1 Tax=Mycena chlorophos TaxID=658473 RepID=A0ABQ0LC35_MYCCL|nr:predicted protein [Mycena chlorophos]
MAWQPRSTNSLLPLRQPDAVVHRERRHRRRDGAPTALQRVSCASCDPDEPRRTATLEVWTSLSVSVPAGPVGSHLRRRRKISAENTPVPKAPSFSRQNEVAARRSSPDSVLADGGMKGEEAGYALCRESPAWLAQQQRTSSPIPATQQLVEYAPLQLFSLANRPQTTELSSSFLLRRVRHHHKRHDVVRSNGAETDKRRAHEARAETIPVYCHGLRPLPHLRQRVYFRARRASDKWARFVACVALAYCPGLRRASPSSTIRHTPYRREGIRSALRMPPVLLFDGTFLRFDPEARARLRAAARVGPSIAAHCH